jgi:hypothetical protein
VPGAQAASLAFRASREALAHHFDTAAVRLIEAGEAGEERRLPAAGRAD